MDRLPEELCLRILECLEMRPPSELKARQEPSVNLTHSTARPLKTTSCLSRHWRRIALPLLFKHASVQIDCPVKRHWLDCCLHDDGTLDFVGLGSGRKSPQDIDQYHLDMLAGSPRRAEDVDAVPSSWLSKIHSANHAYELQSKAWASRMYHASRDFIDFVISNRLQKHVSSLVLFSDDMKCAKSRERPSPVLYDWRYGASAAMWQHLLSLLGPQRLAIVAPPTELACFANVHISLDAAWAFTDMDYHVLELEVTPSLRKKPPGPLSYAQLQSDSNCSIQRAIARSSILNLQDWASISLNEGSFLKAYATYEYFEHGPPSLISSIASNLVSSNTFSVGMQYTPVLAALRSFTYTAIFPFANHLDFLGLLPQLETLDLQFAPDPQSGILDDKLRTGKAELQDCWQELISGYHDIASAISTFVMSKETFPWLKTFICRDVRIPALKNDLDHIFTPLCLPVWAEYEEGVFSRIADNAELPGKDGIV